MRDAFRVEAGSTQPEPLGPSKPGTRYDIARGFHDPRGRLTVRDLPCPAVAVNFLVQDLTRENGPIRQICGTQRSREPIPSLEEEPLWMKLSTICPAPAGAAIIRDVRCHHGGTPNLSDRVRSMPNVEFAAPWYAGGWRLRDMQEGEVPRSMPRSIFEGLSPHAQRCCREIVQLPGTEGRFGFGRTGAEEAGPGLLGGLPPARL